MGTSTIVIRQTCEKDVEAFRALRLNALKSHPEAFGADYEANLARPMGEWLDHVRPDPENNSTVYVAEYEDSLIGMTGIYRGKGPKARHSGFIWGVYVRGQWRGTRLADKLVSCCLDWAKEQQIHIVKLNVVTTNGPAIRCYHRCGFEVYGVEPQAIYYDGVYYDELMMAKRL